MTVYLLAENVLRELHPKGNARVRAWYATVADNDLRISALTFFEKRRGAERLRKSDPERAAKLIAAIEALEASYGTRLVPIDGPSSPSGRDFSAPRTRINETGRSPRQRVSTASSSSHATSTICVAVTSEC